MVHWKKILLSSKHRLYSCYQDNASQIFSMSQMKERKVLYLSKKHFFSRQDVINENTSYLLRSTKCPECECNVPNQPSPKEFSDMAEDGRVVVIKAQKISFWKQFERGVLSSDAVNVLVNLADTCLDERDRYFILFYFIFNLFSGIVSSG